MHVLASVHPSNTERITCFKLSFQCYEQDASSYDSVAIFLQDGSMSLPIYFFDETYKIQKRKIQKTQEPTNNNPDNHNKIKPIILPTNSITATTEKKTVLS